MAYKNQVLVAACPWVAGRHGQRGESQNLRTHLKEKEFRAKPPSHLISLGIDTSQNHTPHVDMSSKISSSASQKNKLSSITGADTSTKLARYSLVNPARLVIFYRVLVCSCARVQVLLNGE